MLPVDHCKNHSSSELSSHISVELACARRIIPENMRCRGCAQEIPRHSLCIKNHQTLDCALFGMNMMNMMNIQKDPSYFGVNSRVLTLLTAISVSPLKLVVDDLFTHQPTLSSAPHVLWCSTSVNGWDGTTDGFDQQWGIERFAPIYGNYIGHTGVLNHGGSGNPIFR